MKNIPNNKCIYFTIVLVYLIRISPSGYVSTTCTVKHANVIITYTSGRPHNCVALTINQQVTALTLEPYPSSE